MRSRPAMKTAERILVIKLGALGDWVQATGPFAAIRARHPAAYIVLLTGPLFAALGRRCGWFDDVWTDDRPGRWRVFAWRALRRRLAGGGGIRPRVRSPDLAPLRAVFPPVSAGSHARMVGHRRRLLASSRQPGP